MAKGIALDLPDLHYGHEVLPNLNGYLVRTLDRRTLLIRGLTDTATMHGVVAFLERYVGVRQYWLGPPGGIGDVVPHRPTLHVPQLEWRDWPFFFSRRFTMHPFGAGFQPLDFFRRHTTLPCNESYGLWLPPAKYAKTHPEFFPLGGNQRRIPTGRNPNTGWQPCVSNPEVVRTMAEAVIDYFDKHREAVGVNVSVNDGGGDCQCPACRAMDNPDAPYPARLSDRYARFTNAICEIVARRHPSKTIVYLAYAQTQLPPRTVKLHPNIMPVLTVPQNMFAAWDQWLATGTGNFGLYLHHNDNGFFLLPKLDIHQTARRIRYAAASDRARLIYVESHPLWPLSAPVVYVTSRLAWDPRQDVDMLLKQFYQQFFGPAAEPMERFYRQLEAGYERWLQQAGKPHPFGRDITSLFGGRSPEQFRVLTPEEAARAAEALKEAASAARVDRRAAERVQIVRRLFGLIHLAVQQF